MKKIDFLNALRSRILILDGGMGTMIQRLGLSEADYRGDRFRSVPSELKGNNDLLSISRPDVIRDIHRQYLEAGADIFTTNTFNSTAISQEDYGTQAFVREMNLASARLAREEADRFMSAHPQRTIFVAGSLGPTNKTASMSPDVSDPAFRAVTYRQLYDAYTEQIAALIEGAGRGEVPCAGLDITMSRDDLVSAFILPDAQKNDLGFPLEGKTVVLCDDVLHTGRSAVAGIEALFRLGRPSRIQLLVLVDRGGRELPVRADYVGKNVPTSREEYIEVHFKELGSEDSLTITRR